MSVIRILARREASASCKPPWDTGGRRESEERGRHTFPCKFKLTSVALYGRFCSLKYCAMISTASSPVTGLTFCFPSLPPPISPFPPAPASFPSLTTAGSFLTLSFAGFSPSTTTFSFLGALGFATLGLSDLGFSTLALSVLGLSTAGRSVEVVDAASSSTLGLRGAIVRCAVSGGQRRGRCLRCGDGNEGERAAVFGTE